MPSAPTRPADPSGEGLRARKKRETRRSIARAALRLAQEAGPDPVTIEAIAEAADVSPRTIFNHFATREDAILNIGLGREEEIRARFAERPPDEPPMRSLRAVLVDASERIDADLGDWRERVRLVQAHPGALHPRYIAGFAVLERALVEELAGRMGADAERDLQPALLVATAMAAMRAATDTWQAAPRSARLEDLIDQAFAQLAAGLG